MRQGGGRLTRAAMLSLLLAGALPAQVLRVRLVDDQSREPVSGALVSATAAVGPASTAVLSAPTGVVVVHVAAAGSYRVLVRRIGYAPFTSEALAVTGDDDPPFAIVLPSRRITLATVRVTAHRTCDARAPSPSRDAEPLWEEVRKALESSALTRELMVVTTAGVTFERQLTVDGTFQRVDTTSRGTSGARPFVARDAASLEHSGYVEGDVNAGFSFYAPDERVLLSDGFTQLHCVSVAAATRHDALGALVGLAFEPRTESRLSEIKGTLWVDSASAELRRVEFDYVRAPMPVPVERLGGFVAFERTKTGLWIVSDWLLRLPHWPTAYVMRSGVRLDGYTEVGGSARVVREVVGLPASVTRTITGSIFDSLSGLLLTGARVQLLDLGRDTVTDAFGRFRFENVGSGWHRLAAAYPAFDARGLFSVGAEVDLISVATADVALATPSLGTLWSRWCGAAPAAPDMGIIFGRVVLQPGGEGDRAATVEAGAAAPVRTDSIGSYRACGVPTRIAAALRATHDSISTNPMFVWVGSSRVLRRDLTLASDDAADALWTDSANGVPATGTAGDLAARALGAEGVAAGGLGSAVVTGVVRDATGRAIKDVRTRIAGVPGETRTDARGAFIHRDVPAGTHGVSIEAIGFARARRVVDVQPGDSAFLDVRLPRLTSLSTVTVKERARINTLRSDIHTRTISAHGYMIDSLALSRMGSLREAFHYPNTRIHTSPGGFIVEIQRPGLLVTGENPERFCQPALYIDDIPMGMEFLSQQPKETIALIEYYNRPANAPLQYTGTASLGHAGTSMRQGGQTVVEMGTCGVILVWTKAFINVGDPSKRP
ncbi:MAG: carboxypeptidase-like regulatory domain-containing protein [Gemmatimonadales bacterium]